MVVRIARGIDAAVTWLCVAALVVLVGTMTGTVVAGVFWRYVLSAPLSWSEEVARFAMIWAAFIGGALAFRRGGHIAIGLVVDVLPRALRWLVLAAGWMMMLGFLWMLFWYGWTLAEQVRFQRSPALRMSMRYAYAAVPVGAALMIYHMCAAALETLSRGDPKQPAPPAGLG